MASLNLAGRSILVVEDEALVRLDVAGRLQDAGATVLSASRLDKALDLASHPNISAGVLDFDLGGGDSSAICWKLVDRRIPFVFHSGRLYTAFRQWRLPKADLPILIYDQNRKLGAFAKTFEIGA